MITEDDWQAWLANPVTEAVKRASLITLKVNRETLANAYLSGGALSEPLDLEGRRRGLEFKAAFYDDWFGGVTTAADVMAVLNMDDTNEDA
jgi:hypothetical protein